MAKKYDGFLTDEIEAGITREVLDSMYSSCDEEC
jgi:hypothetical protein